MVYAIGLSNRCGASPAPLPSDDLVRFQRGGPSGRGGPGRPTVRRPGGRIVPGRPGGLGPGRPGGLGPTGIGGLGGGRVGPPPEERIRGGTGKKIDSLRACRRYRIPTCGRSPPMAGAAISSCARPTISARPSRAWLTSCTTNTCWRFRRQRWTAPCIASRSVSGRVTTRCGRERDISRGDDTSVLGARCQVLGARNVLALASFCLKKDGER